MKKSTEMEIESLREIYPRGSTVYIIIEHVARSGMLAVLRPVAFLSGSPICPAWGVSRVTGMTFTQKNGYNGIRVSGCRFNRAQHVAENIAQALYGDPRALKYQVL